MRLRTSCKDQVHAVLAKLGVPVTCTGIFGKAGLAWLDQLGLPQPYAGKVTSLRQLTAELTMLGEVIADLLAGDHGYQVIQQLPGIGPVLAAVIIAEIGDVTRFRTAAQLCSWAGLTPRHRESWRNRKGRRLTVAGYRATGGIDGAVAQAADSVYNRLDLGGQAVLQRVLLRLVTIGEGIPNTRRRVALAELTGSEDGERATPTSTVLTHLIDARLVTADGETVEITHETLLTAWPRLQQWLAEDRKALLIHRDLIDATRDWEQEGRDPSHLFRGTRLAVVHDWAADHGDDLNSDERAFLAASQHDQRRTIRLRRAAVATLAVLTVVSSIAAVVAGIQRLDAVTQSRAAQSEEMAAEATDLFSADAPLAMLLSLQAYERAPTLQARSALIEAAGQPLSDVLTEGANAVASVAFSPDGQTLAVGGPGGHIGLWDTGSGRRTATLSENSPVYTVAFSPNGKALAAGGLGGNIGLWNIASGRRTVTLAEGGPVDSVAFRPNGQTLAAGDTGGHIGLWNIASGRRTVTLAEDSPVAAVAFSRNGQTLAAGDTGSHISLWDTGNGQRTLTLAEGSPVNSVAFSPNGQTLAIGDLDGSVTLFRQSLWNLTGSSLSRLICGEVRKNMTQAQWAANALGQPYQKTCSAYP